ncbi:hypothetical protein D3C77_600860 [compost metagenome]
MDDVSPGPADERLTRIRPYLLDTFLNHLLPGPTGTVGKFHLFDDAGRYCVGSR